MYPAQVFWDLPDEPGGNVQHMAAHGLSVEDVENVLFGSTNRTVSRSSGEWITFGFTIDRRYIAVVWQEVDDDGIRPVTAYEVPVPRRKKRK